MSRTALMGLAVLVLAAGVVLGIGIGPTGPSWPEAALLSLRMTRVALAVVVGAGLSVAGAALQSLLRNPLADPFVLGVSGGAAMGAALAVFVASLVGGAAGGSGGFTTVGAVIGAVVASTLLLAFSKVGPDEQGGGAVLVGVVTNAFSWAVVAVIRAVLPAQDAAGLGHWLVGALHHPDVTSLALVTATSFLGGIALLTQGAALTLLQGGDDDAARLGVDVGRVRVSVVAAASVVVGAAVATTGVIGFVGLLVPHAVRRLGAGGDDRLALPAAAIMGGGLLAGLDGAARGAFSLVGSELPVGALCALLGAPVLAVLLVREARGGRR
jgi:iron complex transport system permease protein